MKNLFSASKTRQFGIIALVAIMGFGVMACGGNSSDGDKKQTDALPSETTFSVKGEFDDKKFSLANAENYTRAAVSAESYAIAGELEDGAIIFRLSGTYDPVARNYTASAASSMIRFSISGAFNEQGDSLGSTATVLTKDGDNWTAVSFVVTESNTVTFTATEIAPEYDGGIPEWARGWWRYSGFGFSSKVLFSQWAFMEEYSYVDDGKTIIQTLAASIIETENKGAYWDVIAGYPVYIGSREQLEAAALAFLTSKGLTGTKLDENPWGNMPNLPEFYYCVSILEDDINGGTFLMFFGHFPDSILTQVGPNEYESNSEIWDAINEELYSNSEKYPATVGGKAALEAFIAKALSDKSLTATKLDEMPIFESVEVPEGIYYFYENGEIWWNYGPGDGGYNEAIMN